MKWLRKLLDPNPDWKFPEDPGQPEGHEFQSPLPIGELQEVMNNLGVGGTALKQLVGPAVTEYHVRPKPNARDRAFAGSVEDLKIHLGVDGVRYMGSIGAGHVGFEIANKKRVAVPLEFFLTNDLFDRGRVLPIALSRTNGTQFTFDLADAPHMIIAGATGSGKSVLLNTILSGWMYTRSPDEVKLLLIDPKRTEFLKFGKTPHVDRLVTEPYEAVAALQQLVELMEARYKAIASKQCSNYKEWNKVCRPNEWMAPYVCVIDEFADLYLSDKKGVGEAVIKLAQKARAAGIHLIIATQRPSADVFPGLIKANFPVRIALRVSSRVNSQVIIDEPGAENLLGMGDCLMQDGSRTVRLHGPWIDNEHVGKLVRHWAKQK